MPGSPRDQHRVQIVAGVEPPQQAPSSAPAHRARSPERPPDGRPPPASALIKAPDVSVSSVRVSETVRTARFKRAASGRAMLDHGLAHRTHSLNPIGQRILPSLTFFTRNAGGRLSHGGPMI